ncbi:spore cortex biosynthesis protein YabQ [Lederbergia citrea]|uniref:spore cortex biosynthesis protein YabQ n=1 Tax=Lederbergia citrea TaxID=2833581 RepID=UPI001BC911EE|nr:spore cortex biosynthesis protein YabQ [Lederbergia citrea]MBS4179722.1 spore cortex biosynthesis protein YabQ [Lederbergia citrea]MBS4206429.1 spore cortex biosynthesis protein YabQ [Lederbergia citrea]
MSLSTQFFTMLSMIAMGSFFGASLDTYQRFLKRGKRKRLIVFLNDILFWIIQGLIIFYILFLVNHGELRFYLILALLCGFSAYQALIKHLYLKFLELLINFTIKTALFIRKLLLNLIYRPIKGLILLLIGVLLFTARILFGLVKITGRVLLWILKIILFPFKLIGRGFILILPNSVKKAVGRLYAFLAGLLKAGKNKYIKVINVLRKVFRK